MQQPEDCRRPHHTVKLPTALAALVDRQYHKIVGMDSSAISAGESARNTQLEHLLDDTGAPHDTQRGPTCKSVSHKLDGIRDRYVVELSSYLRACCSRMGLLTSSSSSDHGGRVHQLDDDRPEDRQ
jgi:hypothetical protein